MDDWKRVFQKVAHHKTSLNLVSVPDKRLIIMQTGIKQLDKIVAKCGISGDETNNKFQSSLRLFRNDNRLKTLNLPHCLASVVCNLRYDESVILHRFYLAYRDNPPRLAFFLTDDDGRIIERVYFLRHAKYMNAAAAIGKQLRRQHAVAA